MRDSGSEWITDGKMITQTVLEFGHVVVTALSRVVGSMQSDAYVETQHKKVQIAADAEACARIARRLFGDDPEPTESAGSRTER